MMQEFLIEFSFQNNGRRRYRKEIIWAENAQEAVQEIRFRDDYYYEEPRVEKVWCSRNVRWEETEAWE